MDAHQIRTTFIFLRTLADAPQHINTFQPPPPNCQSPKLSIFNLLSSPFPPPIMSTRRGPTAGPKIQQFGHRLIHNASSPRSNPKPPPSAASAAAANASAIASIHARMRAADPSIAELQNPTGRQPKNGGMSAKDVIAEKLRQRKVRKREQGTIQRRDGRTEHNFTVPTYHTSLSLKYFRSFASLSRPHTALSSQGQGGGEG